MLSIDESLRLMDYFERINPPNSNPQMGIPNSLPPPPPDPTGPTNPDNRTGSSTGPAGGTTPTSSGGSDVTHYYTGTQHQLASDFRPDFWRGFEHGPLLVIAESESGDDSADEQEGPLSYARLLSPYSKLCREIVRQHEKEAVRNSELRMMRWVDDVARFR